MHECALPMNKIISIHSQCNYFTGLYQLLWGWQDDTCLYMTPFNLILHTSTLKAEVTCTETLVTQLKYQVSKSQNFE